MTAVWGPNVTMGFWGLYWGPHSGGTPDPRGRDMGLMGLPIKPLKQLLGMPNRLMGSPRARLVTGYRESLGIGYLG